MKLLIASDIHGSAYYAQLLARRADEEKPDGILLLGDYLYHGPRNGMPRDYDPVKTAGIRNGLAPRPLCIRGNCDSEVDQLMIDYPILAEFAAFYADGRRMYLTHGHHMDAACAAVGRGDVILYGHTHLPDFTERDGVVRVNPGSVTFPKEDTPHSCLRYENGVFSWLRVESGEVWKQEKL